MKRVLSTLQDFKTSQNGSVSIELCLMVPIMLWALLSTFVYFDAYRAEAKSNRAGLTIADMISRERDSVDSGYITAARSLLRALSETGTDPRIRVTTYSWDDTSKRYEVEWSQHRGMTEELTTAMLVGMENRLPIMADGARSILVETEVDYVAPFSMGIGPFSDTNLNPIVLRTFTVISPRFMPTVCYDPTPANPTNGDALC
jgi:Flp pilus assembly protein TadG